MGDEGVGPRNEFHPTDGGGWRKGGGIRRPFAHSCILARAMLHVYARSVPAALLVAVDDGRGCRENDNAALERRFVNTLEKMRGASGRTRATGQRRRGAVDSEEWRGWFPGGKRARESSAAQRRVFIFHRSHAGVASPEKSTNFVLLLTARELRAA